MSGVAQSCGGLLGPVDERAEASADLRRRAVEEALVFGEAFLGALIPRLQEASKELGLLLGRMAAHKISRWRWSRWACAGGRSIR